MERSGEDHGQGNNNYFREDNPQVNGGDPILTSSNLWLDHVGEVSLTLNSNGLSWNLINSTSNEQDGTYCLGLKLIPNSVAAIKISDVYAVEFVDWGTIHGFNPASARVCLLGHNNSEMYRFSVHTVQRSKNQPSLWIPSVYTFGHEDFNICGMWVNCITNFLNTETERPKNLLVFVHPKSGKGNGCWTWETVAPIFSRAKVKTEVIVTEKAGHAYSVMSSMSNEELHRYDGVIAVGGDGFFNEILNGLLLQRLKAPCPPVPTDIFHSDDQNHYNAIARDDENKTIIEPSYHNASSAPLLPVSTLFGSTSTDLRTVDGDFIPDEGFNFSVPNKWFRLGLIPAGSTDAIVMCTTGARDCITSALHIVLGKRVSLDIAQVVRWKTTSTSTSKEEPCVRYAASFAGYGFYGDVITESEKYRWMGPKRYDYAGTMVFLKHKAYEAEVAYLEEKPRETSSSERAPQSNRKRALWGLPRKPERMVCRANCGVCRTNTNCTSSLQNTHSQSQQESKWLRSKGHFLSIGGAVISCRNERAPDGLVADAHLSDGFLDLILIKECPHALYLWHLTQLARKGGSPLNFEFVEHHKTRAFAFTSFGKESMWNLDGEIFQAHQLSAQVFRGLVSLFASGPEA